MESSKIFLSCMCIPYMRHYNLHLVYFLLPLSSRIDVGQGINVRHGKFGKKNKHRALNTHVLWSKQWPVRLAYANHFEQFILIIFFPFWPVYGLLHNNFEDKLWPLHYQPSTVFFLHRVVSEAEGCSVPHHHFNVIIQMP